MSLLRALKDYFGFKHGQTLSEFMAEVKTLDNADRAYFIREFAKIGIVIQGE
jgi:hypothetical protein